MAVIAEQANLHCADAAVEGLVDHLEIGIGGPGEVVYVFGVIADGLGAVAIVLLGDLHAGRADDVVLRQCDLHVVRAEVGEELGHGVELMAIPLAVPPHADLGEPLSREEERPLVAGARDDLGNFALKEILNVTS